MNKSTKSKWIVGIAGTALSAFVLGQIGGNQHNLDTPNNDSFNIEAKVYADMDDREKELAQLDWSNFTISDGNPGLGESKSDRQTRRS